MNPCEACSLDDKIYECCGRFPETGETVPLRLDSSRTVTACPHLKTNGDCRIYENRPYGCRIYFCHAYNTYQPWMLDKIAR